MDKGIIVGSGVPDDPRFSAKFKTSNVYDGPPGQLSTLLTNRVDTTMDLTWNSSTGTLPPYATYDSGDLTIRLSPDDFSEMTAFREPLGVFRVTISVSAITNTVTTFPLPGTAYVEVGMHIIEDDRPVDYVRHTVFYPTISNNSNGADIRTNYSG